MRNLNTFKSSPDILKNVEVVIILCLITAAILIIGNTPSEADAIEPESVTHLETESSNDKPSYVPVYRISLRVHIGKSGRSPSQFRMIFDEINDIWWSQAGICFEIQAVNHDKPQVTGADIWFLPVLKEYSASNGYYNGDHEIYVRDNPILGFASRPAKSSAARTAAHELGHVLGLHHRQDSDDNLMRSKTFGWQLSEREILHARAAAPRKSLHNLSAPQCGTPEIRVAD